MHRIGSLVLPWMPGVGVYDDDGPKEAVTFDAPGHTFHVAPTAEHGIHSGRTRFRVECKTCGVVVHAGSTSATAQVRFHLERAS